MRNQSSGQIPGGSYLLRMLRQYRKLAGSADAISVRFDDLTFYLDPYDDRLFFVFDELLNGGEENRLLRRALSPGDTFLDVGANHGTYSLLARALVGPQGAVHAFEPQPALARLIGLSFDASKFHNCHVHQVALSDRHGEATFYIPSDSGLASLHAGYLFSREYRELEVRTAPLDQFLDWGSLPGRLFIKLDVEGNELKFLQGARNVIKNRRPLLIIEINPASAKAAGHDVSALFHELREQGYERYAEMDGFPETAPLEDLASSRLEVYRDIVMVPSASGKHSLPTLAQSC